MTNVPTHPVCLGVLTQVLTLLGGALLAQVITFVAQVGIARLYTDTDLGYLRIFTSTATLGAAVASARFDLSTVLPVPGDETSARFLADFASRCVLVASALTTLIVTVAWPWVSARYGSALTGQMLTIGIPILSLAQGQMCSYWLTRHWRFRAVANLSVIRALGVAVLQLVCGFVTGGGLGTAIRATIAGQGIAVAYLSWRAHDTHEHQDTDPTLREIALHYRRMTPAGMPNTVVNALRTSTIPMLIATYSAAALGQFSLAWLAFQVLVALIAEALSQVYLPRLSDTPLSGMTRVTLHVGDIALACSVSVFALFAWVGPAISPFVFRAHQETVGYFARSLAPWFTLTAAASPLSNVFAVTYHQRRMLALACVYCAAPPAWLVCSPYGVETTVAVFRALMAVLLVGILLTTVVTARTYDRGDVT